MILQQEFERDLAKLDSRSKSLPQEKLRLLQSLLDGAPESVRSGEFARLTNRPSNNAFDGLLAQAFVERSIKSNDVKSLELLLAMNCPEYLAAMPIEFVLARSKLPDAILLLSHAYSAGATNAASQVALRCLARAFPALKQSAQSDKSFVVACEIWWIENRMKCAVNLEYPHLPGRPAPPPGERITLERLGLFIPKA